MGLNAFFAFTVVLTYKYTWQQALAGVFCSGVIFLLISIFRIREYVINAIPKNLKLAISAGVGLFLGSAKAIHDAGPGLLLAYALGGVAIFFIMRALGELLTYRPVAGSFATYADEFCGPLPGFVTGWSYWFAWVATVMAEITAIGIYVQFWLPHIPQWLPPLVALLVLYGTNLLAVRVFGELELWFALIKVVTLVALLVSLVYVVRIHHDTRFD